MLGVFRIKLATVLVTIFVLRTVRRRAFVSAASAELLTSGQRLSGPYFHSRSG